MTDKPRQLGVLHVYNHIAEGYVSTNKIGVETRSTDPADLDEVLAAAKEVCDNASVEHGDFGGGDCQVTVLDPEPLYRLRKALRSEAKDG